MNAEVIPLPEEQQKFLETLIVRPPEQWPVTRLEMGGDLVTALPEDILPPKP